MIAEGQRRYIYHIAALFTVTVWGATFVSTKVLIGHGLSSADIFLMRFVIAYICIWGVSFRRIWAGSLRDELMMAVAGISGGSMYFLTENDALIYSPASNVSLIVCTAPVWTAITFSILYRSERMTHRQVVGSVLAFTGTVLVILNGRFVLHLTSKGDLLALSAALLWVVYSMVIKHIGDKYSTIFITRKIFFYGILTILPIFVFRDSTITLERISHPAVWLNILFLGLIASMLCYVLWNAAMTHLGAIRTTNYIYINPLVTIITAALFINERITPLAVLGAGLTVFGMWRAGK